MAGADDEIVWPLIVNDNLIAVGLAPKDDDDTHEDAVALLGNHVSSGSAAPIDLDGGGGGEGATTTRTPVYSNGLTPSVAGTSTSSGPSVAKRKSAVWANFDEIYETVNGRKICTKATCKIYKYTLSARSYAGTSHLKRH